MDYFDLLVKVAVFPGMAFITMYAYFVIWLERKLLARVMLRIGPLHVGRVAGVLQVMADFIKLLGKELIIPYRADRFLFISLPVVAVGVASLPLAAIPFDEYWVIFRSEFSLLYVFAAVSLAPIISLLTGWASNNKYSFIGGLRAAYQLLGYEVPVFLSLASVAILSSSLDLMQIVRSQSNLWFVFLTPMGFIIFLISSLAELERSPFDIPEAEQEIVAGWMTEYTGISFGLFYLANYIRLCIVSLLVTSLFLGGWFGPAFLPPMIWFLLKSGSIACLIILIRGAYPRVRMDQLLRICWRFLIPLAIANLAITAIAAALITGKPFMVW